MSAPNPNPAMNNRNFPKSFDTLILNANVATFSTQYGFDRAMTSVLPSSNTARQINSSEQTHHTKHRAYGQLENAAIAIQNGKINWIGDSETAKNALMASDKHFNSDAVIDVEGKWITPGLIDCHTHLVYAGNRSNEFEARLQGASYKSISDNGGGIIATVTATRSASFEALYQQSEVRLQALLTEGVTCLEIKSGYGLNLETERKMLQVARQLGEDYGIMVKTTYLAAHALPSEFRDKADGANRYIDAVCEWMHVLHTEGLIDSVDGYIENIGFDKAQMTQVLDTAQTLGLPIKLHAEQLSNMDGSALVAQYKGLSSDHLEYLTPDNVALMAKQNVVAVLLPGAFYTLKETRLPPMQALYEHNVAIALSTDCNPGTSPITSLLMIMNMGCTLFGLTPEQALAGITTHAAKALGIDSKGRIEMGMDADLAIWDITRPADLAYQMGLNPLSQVMVNGKWR